MHIDPLTLMIAGSFVGTLSGLVLFGAWTLMRTEKALLWWAIAGFAYSSGIGLIALAPGLPDSLGMTAGLLLTVTTSALVWGGTRRFHNRSVPWLAIAAGPACWLALLVLGGGAPALGTVAGLLPWVVYLAAAAFELWRGRAEHLTARWTLLGLFMLHAAVYVAGIADALDGALTPGGPPTLNSWFGIINVEGLLYFMGTAISMVGMAQQRREHHAVLIAGLDSLTGAANRGTFLDLTQRLLHRCRQQEAPLSLIMFDLDHFKTINDTFGHLTGDNVIRAFAETARRALRPNDVLGRYGGEEFAVVLPGTTAEAAYVIAERIRHNFADAGRVLEEVNIRATVSGGVAMAGTSTSVAQLVDAADRALYRAKHLGRNRVQRHEDDAPRSNVVRVA